MTRNIIAIIVLIALGIAALVVFREKPSGEVQKTQASIPAVPTEKLDTIQIQRTEDGAPEKIVLQKKEDRWQMVEPVSYPVVESSVQSMVETLSTLKPVDIISENKEKHASFQVDDEQGVQVTALNGTQELIRLIIGKSKSNMTFVRIPGGDAVYRIHGTHGHIFNKSAQTLRDKTILSFKPEDAKKMLFKAGETELTLAKGSDPETTKWAPVAADIENFDEDKATGILRALSNLNARSFVDQPLPADQTGLSDTVDRVVVETQSGELEPQTYTVYLGKDDEKDSKTYVKTSESEQVFLVSSHTTKRFRVGPNDFARTEEDMKKEAERKQKAAQAGAGQGMPGMPGMPGMMGGPGGNQQIPPELMRQIQAQMAKQQGQGGQGQ